MELDQNDASLLPVSAPEPQMPAADAGVDQVVPSAEQNLNESHGIRADGRPRTRVPPASDERPPAPPPQRPGYAERARLNAVDSFYRGTLLGAFELNRLYRLSYLQEGEDETPDRKVEMEFHRPEYEKIASDLHAYDNMEGFANVSEAAVAFAGQFGASLLSPEAWLAPHVRGATLAIRAVKAGLAQAGLQLMTDPVTQRLSIDSRVQESYDPWRTGERAAMGFAVGAGARAAASGAGRWANPSVPPNPPGSVQRQTPLNPSPQPRKPQSADAVVPESSGVPRPRSEEQKLITSTLRSLTDPDAVSRAAPFDRNAISEGALAKADALIGYVRDVVKPSRGEKSVPRFLFDLDVPSGKVLSALRNVDVEIADAAAQGVRLPNQVIDKLYHKNSKEADRILSQLPELLENGAAFRDKPGDKPRWILTAPYPTLSGSSKNQIAVIEIARANNAAEIVSIHVIPGRSLNKIKNNPWKK